MKKVSIILAILVLILLAGLVYAETVDSRPILVINLKANQTVSLTCQGDDIIIDPSVGQIDVTCRVWLNGNE